MLNSTTVFFLLSTSDCRPGRACYLEGAASLFAPFAGPVAAGPFASSAEGFVPDGADLLAGAVAPPVVGATIAAPFVVSPLAAAPLPCSPFAAAAPFCGWFPSSNW